LVNNIRTSNGLPALEVSSILMSTAQSTAEIMAANRMGWHIGDVRGRVMAAGYGGGANAWATENFAIGPMSLEDLTWMWSDADHMIPMLKPAYQHIGAGVATAADGSTYYIVHAAYASGSASASTQPPGSTGAEPTAPAAQWIIPVVTATPAADGAVVHEVKMGQSLWSIAIAYNTHIVDILRFNQLSPEQQVVWVGQKLNIPVTPQPTLRQAQGTASSPAEPVEADTMPNATATPRKIAANLNAATPVAEPVKAPVGTTTPILTPASQQPAASANSRDRVIGYILGSIFAVGALLVGFGLLARRENS